MNSKESQNINPHRYRFSFWTKTSKITLEKNIATSTNDAGEAGFHRQKSEARFVFSCPEKKSTPNTPMTLT